MVHNPCMLQVCSGYGMSQVNDHVHVLSVVCLSGYLYAYTSLYIVISVQSICLCTFLSHCRCRVKEPEAKVG